MKVLLYEQWWGGHHLNYLDCLVPRLAGLADSVVIAVEGRTLETELATRWRQFANVEFAPALPFVSPQLRARDRVDAARHLLRTLEAVRPDITLLPSADAQASLLAMLNAVGLDELARHGPIEGTMHFGYGHAAANSKERMKEFIYSETLRRVPFSVLNIVSFAYHDYVAENGLAGSKELRFVGDPVPQPVPIGRRAARELLGLDPSGRYFGLLGMLDQRKAVPALLAAFRAAALPADHRLLLAGRLDARYAELIRTDYQDFVADGRLIVHDRYLSDLELQHGYEALDVATVVYHRFPGLASLGLKAIAAGTPLVVDDFGWLRGVVRRFEVGRAVDIHDTPRFAATLREAIEAPRGWARAEAVERLMAFHAEANFTTLMCRSVERAAGRGTAPSPLEWSWVLEALPPEQRAVL